MGEGVGGIEISEGEKEPCDRLDLAGVDVRGPIDSDLVLEGGPYKIS